MQGMGRELSKNVVTRNLKRNFCLLLKYQLSEGCDFSMSQFLFFKTRVTTNAGQKQETGRKETGKLKFQNHTFKNCSSSIQNVQDYNAFFSFRKLTQNNSPRPWRHGKSALRPDISIPTLNLQVYLTDFLLQAAALGSQRCFSRLQTQASGLQLNPAHGTVSLAGGAHFLNHPSWRCPKII